MSIKLHDFKCWLQRNNEEIRSNIRNITYLTISSDSLGDKRKTNLKALYRI